MQFQVWGVRSVLEIGCGEGGVIGQFNTIDDRCGIDFSLDRLTFAKETYPNVRFIHGDVTEELPSYFAPKSYDAVILFDVLEHFEKDMSWRVLEEAERIAERFVVVWGPLGQEGMDRYNKSRQDVEGMYHKCVLEEEEFAERFFFTMVFPKYWERSYGADWTAAGMLAFKQVGGDRG
jgi:ubiquinone/menaquinone biosynthesis C-methylase UbiE